VRYLDAATVRGALPAPAELVDLAELALRSLVGGAEVPEKAGLVPGSNGLFAHAMPARLVAADVPGGGARADLMGLKWIAGGPANRSAGRPALAALIVLNDPETGDPLSILDGDVITAVRTAALSGVAVRLLGPGPDAVGAPSAVLIGAGEQGRAHAEMLGAMLPGIELSIHDRHPERAERLATEAARFPDVGAARAVDDPGPSLARADIVVTATTLGGAEPVLGPRDVARDALVLPVDYSAYVTPALVAAATTFAVDDRGRFEANRRAGRLAGWPDPTHVLGELLMAGDAADQPRRTGLAVALHQGPGIADVIVADAVLRNAIAADLAVELPR
jgi:ornithine cyclodeaminase/alanine dehydrogenase-like protein (mu-crystallin family)